MSQGPNTFKIDAVATFTMLLLMAVEPKFKFGTTDQECVKGSGIPKWTAQVTAGFPGYEGKVNYQVLPVTIVSNDDPRQAVQPGTPVELIDFEVGVMDKTITDRDSGERKVVGAQVYYRASGLRPIGATGRRSEPKVEG
ncbi:hypothetical protein Ae406Ps2_6441c [Pseudonocardia sp. Ae406_Ps2]|uniref:hypothetical protein n=1 Tax=unclassified Pseudonocardia TaxID=2619320 RepID=UPI0009598967|nr:hypothetical protein [Pseudonocardia sp. Ae406_Ps2]OLL89513.1 hypothetical protein Ae406Ps2_6441c [Pseudonocardia sp. Ae406_Ps2]